MTTSEPVFSLELSAAPKARVLHASIPLRRTDEASFTLAQSNRRVPMQRINPTWLACGSTHELGADDRVVLSQLVTDLDGFDIEETTSLSPASGERHRLIRDSAFCFAAERDAHRRTRRALMRLRSAGLVIAVYHHVLVREGDDEFVCRIQRDVPTMRAWSATLPDDVRERLEDFWRDRVAAGHAWDQKRHTISEAVRRFVLERDGHRCQSHGRRYRATRCSVQCRLEVDHIHPVARGGADHADNLQALCSRCNSAKRHHDATHRRLPLLQLTAAERRYRTRSGGILLPNPGDAVRQAGRTDID